MNKKIISQIFKAPNKKKIFLKFKIKQEWCFLIQEGLEKRMTYQRLMHLKSDQFSKIRLENNSFKI